MSRAEATAAEWDLGAAAGTAPEPPRRRRWVAATIVGVIALLIVAAVVRVATLTIPRVQLRVTAPGVVALGGAALRPNWPAQGQAALAIEGVGSIGASGGDTPLPTASLAKVMTAYLTLAQYPLRGDAGGFRLTVTPADVADERSGAAEDQSVVPVQAGETLDERQLLEALLIPSGDNIARLLAVHDAGSIARFVAEMNAEAHSLGMDHTTYTDPSGFDATTVSTAADQLTVFRRALDSAVFREIVSMPNVTLPVAGTVSNYDPVITAGYYGKTGSDSAAEGCLAFFKSVTVAGRRLRAVGVVMGQGYGSATSVILGAAGDAAVDLVTSVTPDIGVRTVLAATSPTLVATSADGSQVTAFSGSALAVIGWRGLRERITISRSRPGTGVRTGATVGRVALAGPLAPAPASPSAEALRTTRPLSAPGLGWRLSHLL